MVSTSLPVIRASSMKVAVNCPASCTPTPPQIDWSPADESGQEGVAGHRAIALALAGKEYPPFDGAGASEMEAMVELALVFARHGELTAGPFEVEKRLSHAPFSATLDYVRAGTGPLGRIVEWKFTWREDNHEAQILAQCDCAFEEFAYLEAIDTDIVFLRGEGVIQKRYTREWVRRWADEFIHNNLGHPEVYRLGPWCERCKRRWNCPAVLESHRQTAAILADPGFEGTLKKELIPVLHPRLKLLKEAIALFEGFARNCVLENGPIALGDGKELRVVEIKRDRIKLDRALPLLQARFSDPEISDFVDVGKTKMLDLLGAKAPRGMKGSVKTEFMESLRQAAAVEQVTETQVRETNVKE